MKRIFIVYTESEDQVIFEHGQMILPANKSMALEFTSPQYVEKLLPLFSERKDK